MSQIQKSGKLLAGMMVLGGVGLTLSAQAQTVRSSTLSGGGQLTGGNSPQAAISGDGNYVAFVTNATNLITVGTYNQVYRKNLTTGETVLVSKDYLGNAGIGESVNPSISSNGKYVCFSSDAQLVPADTNTTRDVYRVDVETGEVVQVSVSTNGVQADSTSDSASMSPNGQFIAFLSTSTTLVLGATGPQVYKRDIAGGTTTVASLIDGTNIPGAGDGTGANQTSISSDGRYVGFSTRDALVANDTNGVFDAYVRDTFGTSTKRTSETATGLQGNDSSVHCSMSDNGRYVIFASNQGFVNGDNNATYDVFRKDTQTNAVLRVSVTTDNKQANGASGWDAGAGFSARISGDGLRVVFSSLATNLVKGDTNGVKDIFVRNLSNNTTTHFSRTSAGKVGNGESTNPTISSTSGKVSFVSAANNLVTGDTNGFKDAFVR